MYATLVGLARIVRPYNCLMFIVGTFVGGIMVAGGDAFRWPGNLPLILASMSAMLVGAGGNVLNDVYDLDIDRINRPTRPLPSGLVSTSQARLIWGVLSVGGVVTAILISPLHLAIAGVSSGLIFAYNARLKSTPLVGNVVVSLVVATALVYGGLSVGSIGSALTAAVFALLTTLARELLKDVQDVAGDSAQAVSSLAVMKGPQVAARVAVIILLVTVGLTVIPFLVLGYSGMYLMLMMVADGMLLGAVWRASSPDPTEYAGPASRWIKVAMLFGLAAFALANVAGS